MFLTNCYKTPIMNQKNLTVFYCIINNSETISQRKPENLQGLISDWIFQFLMSLRELTSEMVEDMHEETTPL